MLYYGGTILGTAACLRMSQTVDAIMAAQPEDTINLCNLKVIFALPAPPSARLFLNLPE